VGPVHRGSCPQDASPEHRSRQGRAHRRTPHSRPDPGPIGIVENLVTPREFFVEGCNGLGPAEFDQLARATDSVESLRKETRELTHELAAIIEVVEAAKAASDFARLKSSIRRAIRR